MICQHVLENSAHKLPFLEWHTASKLMTISFRLTGAKRVVYHAEGSYKLGLLSRRITALGKYCKGHT